VTIDAEKHAGVTKSHRDDIATENSFSMGEREARSSGGFTLKEGGAKRPKG